MALRAQEYSFGLKGGINYSVDKVASEILERPTGIIKSVESGLGFQGGVFFELSFNKFFVRPEIFYSNSSGQFNFPSSFKYSVNKISVPLLLGYNVWGPLDIYAGPAYQNILSNKIENYNGPLENLQGSLAGQLGIKYVYKIIEIDLRYDFTMDSSKNQNIRIPSLAPTAPGEPNALMDDGRLNSLMLSLSLKLFDSANPWRRKSSCYF
tara:strand:+ start:1278 stop:1904 length:627 start_codon:yes stop_codon:yes gene_type:complete